MSDHREDRERFIDEIREKQRNIVFPDTLRGGRSADGVFFKGSPNPPLVQRIACWLLGLTFIGSGLFCLRIEKNEPSILLIFMGWGIVALGVWVCRNGFSRKIEKK